MSRENVEAHGKANSEHLNNARQERKEDDKGFVRRNGPPFHSESGECHHPQEMRQDVCERQKKTKKKPPALKCLTGSTLACGLAKGNLNAGRARKDATRGKKAVVPVKNKRRWNAVNAIAV